MYKVIVAMMMMAVTAAPAAAKSNVDRNARPDKKEMRMTGHKYDRNFDRKVDRGRDRDRHAPVLEVTAFKVSNKTIRHKNVVKAAKAVYGVKDVKWNPRNNMLMVTYDAKKTTARRIKAAVN